MYELLFAGAFGNTLPSFFTVREWRESTGATPGDGRLWGIRHMTRPGYPHCRLNLPTEEVPDHVARYFDGEKFNITGMVPPWSVQWEGDVADVEGYGLVCCGHVSPVPGSWRTHMRSPDEWRGSAAWGLLRTVLNPNSLDDLRVLLDEYPGHVVELSALDRCFGTVPGRNAIVWEVRNY